MSNELSLWSRSAPWRWTLILTILAMSIALLVGPWRTPLQSNQTLAQYTPPKNQNSTQPQILSPQQKSVKSLHNSSSRNTTFDVTINKTVNSFPPGTDLHAIGIYKGAPPTGQNVKPWWSNCPPDLEKAAMMECHQKYASKHTQHTVTVNISRKVPMVLALMAYEPVKWNIVKSPGASIKKVILSGYHGPDITGIPTNIPIDVYSYDPSPCTNCTRQSGYFYASDKKSKEYRQATQKLESLTGLQLSSFQVTHQSNLFSIAANTEMINSNWRNKQSQKSIADYINQYFIDSFILGGKVLPLPEGKWRGIAYEKLSSNRGSDELLVLARIEDNKLRELMTTRMQVSNDGKGFSSNSSCKNKTVYTSVINANEPFGAQQCYLVEHNTAPWQQPIFDFAAAKLTDLELALPTTVINAIFHRADLNSSITTLYYSNPEFSNINTPKSSFTNSLWHPNKISNDPARESFVTDNVEWATTWFQIFTLINQT